MFKISGYKNYSMSNNAVLAYSNGEKPISKWTKADIINQIYRDEQSKSLQVTRASIKRLSVAVLKDIALHKTSWHHTSCHYNETNFYSLDWTSLLRLSEEDINRLINNAKETRNSADKKKTGYWECSFLIWSGSKAHPKAERITEKGYIKGIWFYRYDGTRKKITANGFQFIREIDKNEKHNNK